MIFSVVPLRDELFVCLKDGFILHVDWSTAVVDAEYSTRLSALPFATDQLQSKRKFPNGAVFQRNT